MHKQWLRCGGCRPEAPAAGANGHAGLMLPPPPRPPKRAYPDPDPGLPAAPAGASSDGEADRPGGDAGLGLRAGDAQAGGDAAAHSGGEAGEGLTNPVSGDDAHAAVTAVHAKSAALFREWLAGHKAAQAAAEKARPALSLWDIGEGEGAANYQVRQGVLATWHGLERFIQRHS